MASTSWIIRFGAGFTTGAALIIGVTQLKYALGMSINPPQVGGFYNRKKVEYYYEVFEWWIDNFNGEDEEENNNDSDISLASLYSYLSLNSTDYKQLAIKKQPKNKSTNSDFENTNLTWSIFTSINTKTGKDVVINNICINDKYKSFFIILPYEETCSRYIDYANKNILSSSLETDFSLSKLSLNELKKIKSIIAFANKNDLLKNIYESNGNISLSELISKNQYIDNLKNELNDVKSYLAKQTDFLNEISENIKGLNNKIFYLSENQTNIKGFNQSKNIQQTTNKNFIQSNIDVDMFGDR